METSVQQSSSAGAHNSVYFLWVGPLYRDSELLDRFEQWTRRVYKPREAKWKRPVLLMLSILIGAGCATAAYTQVEHQWANDAVWLVIGVFGFFSGIGLFVSIFCKDYWVALVLGKPKL